MLQRIVVKIIKIKHNSWSQRSFKLVQHTHTHTHKLEILIKIDKVSLFTYWPFHQGMNHFAVGLVDGLFFQKSEEKYVFNWQNGSRFRMYKWKRTLCGKLCYSHASTTFDSDLNYLTLFTYLLSDD